MPVPEMPTLTSTASLAAVLKLTNAFRLRPLPCAGIRCQPLLVLLEAKGLERLGKLHYEINGAPPAPALGNPRPADRGAILDVDGRFDRVVADAMDQVQDDVSVVSGREGIFVEAAPDCRREFRGNLRVLQQHAVIARHRQLIGMGEPRSIALARGAGFELDLADRGHQQHVTQAAAAGSGQMRVAESANGAVGIMIAGAPIPALDRRIGAELNHAKRHDRARISMPMLGGADHWQRLFDRMLSGPSRRRLSDSIP